MSGTANVSVRVDLAGPTKDRSYDILIGTGLLDDAGRAIAERIGAVRAMVMTDDHVAPLYLDRLVTSVAKAGINAETHCVAAGEASKNFETFQAAVDAVLGARLERGDCVIALGGGVVGDLAGFVAASTRRGMGFVQVPTSLLAQVDSSVGGKTGINSRHGKNLVGAFHQPGLVIADTSTLDTLSPREFRAGYAEVAKYGLINDPDFFAFLEANHEAVFAGGSARDEAIARSCRAKAAIVARDEQESGERALLNLGHTFGHALEAAANYRGDVLVHGEGVAIGMAMAHRFSVRMNLSSSDDAARMARHLKAVGLPTSVADHCAERPRAAELLANLDAGAMMTAMAQDKKVTRGAFNLILTRGIGQAFIAKDVPQSELRAFLEDDLR